MGEHPLALPCFVFLAFLDNCRCCPSQTLIIVTLFIVTYLLLLYMLFIIIVTINKFFSSHAHVLEIVKAGQQCSSSSTGRCSLFRGPSTGRCSCIFRAKHRSVLMYVHFVQSVGPRTAISVMIYKAFPQGNSCGRLPLPLIPQTRDCKTRR